MSMFSIWNVQGVANQYKPMPIKEPMPIEPVSRDRQDEEDDHRERSSKAWDKALEKAKEELDQPKKRIRKKVSHHKPGGNLFVEEVMKFPVKSLRPNYSWQSAWDLVTKHDIYHIPILSDEKKLVGIISEKDLLRVRLRSKKRLSTDDNPPISSFMKSNVISALPSISIRRIASVMFQEKIGAMPIVDNHSKLIGIVTMKDILKKLVRHTPIKMWSYD